MNQIKKALLIALCAWMCAGCFTGCQDDSQNAVEDTQNSGSQSSNVQDDQSSSGQTSDDQTDSGANTLSDHDKGLMDVGEGPYYVPVSVQTSRDNSYSYQWGSNYIIEYRDGELNAFTVFEENGYIAVFEVNGDIIPYPVHLRLYSQHHHEIECDEEGNLLRFNGKSEDNCNGDFKYDNSGRLTAIAWKFQSIDGYVDQEENMIPETLPATYDADGRLTTYRYTLNGTTYEVTYTYDEKGNLLPQNKTVEREYDQDGNISKETSYRSDSTIDTIIEYTNGLPVKATRNRYTEGELPDITTYEYNEKGQLLKETRLIESDPNKTLIHEYQYDENGRLSFEKTPGLTYYVGNATHRYRSFERQYEYDAEGHLIREFDDDNSETTFKWQEVSAEQYRFYLRVMNDEEHFSEMQDVFEDPYTK